MINDRDKTIGELEIKIESLNTSLTNATSEIEKLTKARVDFEVKIEKLEETIKSNENMISWLNKQLNDFQGLSNLDKFRQNLASSANQLVSASSTSAGKFHQQQQQKQNNPSPIPYNNNHHQHNNGNAADSTAPPPSSAFSKGYINSAGEPVSAPNSGGLNRRFGAGFSGSNQSQNTLPNGTPSWMHIYQSTSTPLDDDLSSRLEKVSTNPNLGMNYNDLRSRFADPFDYSEGTPPIINPQNEGGVEGGNIRTKSGPTTTTTARGTTRQPTWARGGGRGGRVTLDLTTKPGGILRR